jgi:hypothetical protein
MDREKDMATQTFRFRFDRLHRALGLPFGITPRTAQVVVDRAAGQFVARFGPWTVTTPLSNISEARITSGYSPAKTAGPAHLSMADRGLTFATNDVRGVCILFREPVPGIEPFGRIRHPGLTVTVAGCKKLVEALS